MDINEKVILAVKEKIEDWLNESDIEFFLGGSRRFGYHIEGQSDVDFFILRNDSFYEHKWKEIFDSGLWKIINEPGYPTDITQMELMGIIHFNVFLDVAEYKRLKDEHMKTRLYVNQHQNVVDIAKAAKKIGIKGQTIFKIISAVAHR